MANSFQESTSDGTMTFIDVSIQYLDRADIGVLFDDVLQNYPAVWDWSNPTDSRIVFEDPVPDGTVVRISRTTKSDALRHAFSAGAAFTPRSLDEDLRQALYIAQEAQEQPADINGFTNLNMNGFKVINVGDGTNPGDVVNKSQLDAVAALIGDSAAADVLRADLLNAANASNKGATIVGLYDGLAPAFLKTVSDILQFMPVSILRFISKSAWEDIRAGTSVVDVSDNIQAAIDALNTGGDTMTGGRITFPRGRFAISKKVQVRTGDVQGLSSITLEGDGMHNTMLYALGGFTGGTMLEVFEPTYCKVRGLHLFGASRSMYGLTVQSGSEILLEDVFAQGHTNFGMQFIDNFMVDLRMCRAKSNLLGFVFLGPHTSINAKNCYSLNNTNAGFYLADATYAHFDTCASDSNREGYQIKVAQGLKFTTCGAESNQRAGWHFENSAADNATSANCDGIGATLEECFGYNNNLAGGYGSAIYTNQADTGSIAVRVRGFREATSPGGVSMVLAGNASNHVVRTDEDCKFVGTVAGANQLSIWRPDKIKHSVAYDPPSLADGTGVTVGVNVPRARFGDHVKVNLGINTEGLMMTGNVSSADFVSVRVQNETGAGLDIGATTLYIEVTPKD